mgnify:CR=1 FL=1
MNVFGERGLTDTPCVGICSATALGDAICIGCGRTFNEVIDWNVLSNAEKTTINSRLLKKTD